MNSQDSLCFSGWWGSYLFILMSVYKSRIVENLVKSRVNIFHNWTFSYILLEAAVASLDSSVCSQLCASGREGSRRGGPGALAWESLAVAVEWSAVLRRAPGPVL